MFRVRHHPNDPIDEYAYLDCSINPVAPGRSTVSFIGWKEYISTFYGPKIIADISGGSFDVYRNVDGTITLTSSVINTTVYRWTDYRANTPSETRVVQMSIFPSGTGTSFQTLGQRNILEAEYDAVDLFLGEGGNFGQLRNDNNRYLTTMPVFDLFFGEKPPYHLRLIYQYKGRNDFYLGFA